MRHNPNTNACGESDSAVVPTKCPNKGAVRPAEGIEGRALAKKNHDQASTCRTQRRESVSQGLVGVRQAARLARNVHHLFDNADQLPIPGRLLLTALCGAHALDRLHAAARAASAVGKALYSVGKF